MHVAPLRPQIPFIVKINHNELLTYPNSYDQIMFGTVEQACDMGAAAVGATIYFGSRGVATARSWRSPRPSPTPTSWAWRPCCGATCATAAFKDDGIDYHAAADLTGQANHLGVTIEADIIKQKLPDEQRRLQRAIELRQDRRRRSTASSTTDHPIDLTPLPGRQLLHGPHRADQLRRRLQGKNDLAEAVRTAVINKRAGGTGLISGRKAFQRPMAEGVELLNAIQDVYLDDAVTVA